MALHLEALAMQQIHQFCWCKQDILNHFSRINLLFPSLTHITRQIPPDLCHRASRISKHMREQLDLPRLNAIPRLLHQLTLRRYQWISLIRINPTSRKFQYFQSNTMLVLFIDNETTIFSNRYDPDPPTVFDDIVIRN